MTRALLALVVATTAACGRPVDVSQAVRVDVVTSGWLAAGVVDGRHKIVPAVSLTLKNVSGQTLTALQVNTVFRRVTTKDEIGSDFRPVAGASGLPAGMASQNVLLKAANGYTGADPFDDLLKNSQFVDATVDVFVKAGSGPWTRLGEYPIARAYTGT